MKYFKLRIHGTDKERFIEKLTVVDLARMSVGQSALSVFTNEKGGVLDDTVITCKADHLHLVNNAGCSEKIKSHLLEHSVKFDVKVSFENLSLIAVQGPLSQKVVEKVFGEKFEDLKFMHCTTVKFGDENVTVSRCGYTGEDGFEISVSEKNVVKLVERMLEDGDVKMAGLGARDTLRMEAGLCLYGHEIDEQTGPIEAGLGWTISKRRRNEGGFLGSEFVLKNLNEGVETKRVGIIVSGAPARSGADILDVEGKIVGRVTSGGPSPSLKQNIAMGYIRREHCKVGTEIKVNVRGRNQLAKVAKLPFVAHNYKK
ncbi:hypothetical protein ROZALSC1DRAFT_28626 [Rozella allomycis CSF55]|uniref:Aminomethyltransferase n=1 Tax=Rozella allomycis (strain CSF55) TaxID=988480 RepID=A0A075B2A2_ROZAC|nr:Glycine cleavage T-protein domain-containing protein [Rozella allomycis CSF55]RKP19813.1 hypothetical protein ROZALSC1DRAFT_28626 [Rozella allomycis CSF55]|eukprot:EPZ36657.1 Glycine cleavage T-protein domain-containing protein [Rozella allomycis CSF55]